MQGTKLKSIKKRIKLIILHDFHKGLLSYINTTWGI